MQAAIEKEVVRLLTERCWRLPIAGLAPRPFALGISIAQFIDSGAHLGVLVALSP